MTTAVVDTHKYKAGRESKSHQLRNQSQVNIVITLYSKENNSKLKPVDNIGKHRYTWHMHANLPNKFTILNKQCNGNWYSTHSAMIYL